MSDYIVPLNSIQRMEPSIIGVKAATLSALALADFPIPSGICLTTAAFSEALAAKMEPIEAAIGVHDLERPCEAEKAAATIADLLADLDVSTPALDALERAWSPTMGGVGWVAVRSSATAEDRADASYAGQYHTALGVKAATANVAEAILACWRSFFSANALAARAAHQGLGSHESMAILVQPMIAAECAGVCLTVDPVEKRRDRLIVNATWGLGSHVMDGAAPSDTVWIRRADFEVDRQNIPTKATALSLDTALGLQSEMVPENRRGIPCLPIAWLERIAQFGVVAEQLLGFPQEMEWAIADDRLWILQSRPITALPVKLSETALFPITWKDEADQHELWTLTDSDCIRPLELDLFHRLEEVRVHTCRFLAAERNRQVRVHNGRVYERPIPSGLTDGDRRIRRAALEDLKARLQRHGQTSWDHWGPEIVAATERLAAIEPEAVSGPALATHLEDSLAVRRRNYFLHPSLWFKPLPSYFESYTAIAGQSDEEAETAAYSLLGGSETALTKLIDDLFELAVLAREEETLSSLIVTSPPNLMVRLRQMPSSFSFLDRLDRFLEIHGERTGDGWGSEATLRTPIWREEPEQVLRLIAAYLGPEVEPPSAARERARRWRDRRVDTFCAGCDDPDVVANFRQQLAYARKSLTVLEEHNHYIEQLGNGFMRRAIMAAAARLVATAAIAEVDDIFWLTFDEIIDTLKKKRPDALTTIVAQRRGLYEAWEELTPPPVLGMPNARLPKREDRQVEASAATNAANRSLCGIGASPGRHRGRARVMPDADVLPVLSQGDILVAQNIGPRWTPIFPILGGLILDGGSIGQHAAATAREYGVPAVVNAGDATSRIADGAEISLDGTTGQIWVD